MPLQSHVWSLILSSGLLYADIRLYTFQCESSPGCCYCCSSGLTSGSQKWYRPHQSQIHGQLSCVDWHKLRCPLIPLKLEHVFPSCWALNSVMLCGYYVRLNCICISNTPVLTSALAYVCNHCICVTPTMTNDMRTCVICGRSWVCVLVCTVEPVKRSQAWWG